MLDDDATLLRQFIEEHSDVAFRALVERRIDFVYAAALRQVHDPHLAREITQDVFVALAQKAPRLVSHPVLAGWLHTSTRFAASKALRARARRRHRETEAINLQDPTMTAPERSWAEIRPVVDEALHELAPADRDALLLRFFEGRSHAEVAAVLNVGENAARMRIERALDKLRVRLTRRGITSTAAALGAAFVARPAVAAPAGLAADIAGRSLVSAALGTGSTAWVALHFMSTGKTAMGVASFAAAIGLGFFLGGQHADRVARVHPSEREERVVTAKPSPAADLKPLVPAAEPGLTVSGASPSAGRGDGRTLSALDQLRVLADLRQRKLVRPEINLVTANARITETFRTLFALTAAEERELQQALTAAQADIARLEREHAKAGWVSDDKYVIKVPPFADAGGQVHDRMLTAFANVLGPERHAAYLQLGAEQVEEAMDRFGLADRTVTFARALVPKDGPRASRRTFHVKEEHKLPMESGSSSSDFDDFETMVERIGTVAALLPPDFQGRP